MTPKLSELSGIDREMQEMGKGEAFTRGEELDQEGTREATFRVALTEGHFTSATSQTQPAVPSWTCRHLILNFSLVPFLL